MEEYLEDLTIEQRDTHTQTLSLFLTAYRSPRHAARTNG